MDLCYAISLLLENPLGNRKWIYVMPFPYYCNNREMDLCYTIPLLLGREMYLYFNFWSRLVNSAWKKRFFESLHKPNRNVNPVISKNGDGKNSPFVTQGTFQFPCASQFFPIHGLAVVVKKNFPIRGFAAHGEIFIHYSC